MLNGTAGPRGDHVKPLPLKAPNSGVVSTSGHSHIPTVSANGIPGAAETTVTNLRTTTTAVAATAATTTTTVCDDKASLDLSAGMLGKEKTAMCLVNELSRFNKVSRRRLISPRTNFH